MSASSPARSVASILWRRLRSWWSDHRTIARERATALEAKAREALSLGEAQRLAMEAAALRAAADGAGRRKGIIPLLRN
ncbi:hypothetical protein GCM10022253_03250 [Sphingomonas endophytica]|uniref:Uncharacterized protein n=1 Tax=Sphingomonas endophytica TaxID=869719 RepID=A0ABR6N927_9SPHN|nr:hypothetical protein [Sphingomonas endophytica]MBB5727297.1 hypothetical protein [Sphingomonas endophytica]